MTISWEDLYGLLRWLRRTSIEDSGADQSKCRSLLSPACAAGGGGSAGGGGAAGPATLTVAGPGGTGEVPTPWLAASHFNVILKAVQKACMSPAYRLGDDLLRYKGVLSIEALPKQFVFQGASIRFRPFLHNTDVFAGVHTIFDGQLGRLWRSDEHRESRMVFIGRGLDRDQLEEGLRSCVAGQHEGAAANVAA